ncbi:MAG: T9SS type A sorting domain-containing protein [Saprospiraceae bacterium]
MVSRIVIPLLLSVFCYHTKMVAQDLNLALQPNFFSFAKVVVPAGQGKWLLGGETGQFYGFPSFKPYLVMLDGTGQVLWERRIDNILGTEEGWVSQIIPQKTGNFLVIGEVQGCDYGLPGFMAEYDTLGNQIAFVEHWGAGEIVTQLPSGDLLVGNSGWSNFGRIDLHEGTVWDRQLYASHQFHLKDIVILNEYEAYVLGEKWLFKIDPAEGELIEEKSISNGVDLLVLPARGEILLLSGTNLMKYDANLNLLQTIDLEADVQFYYLKTLGEEIYVVGRNAIHETTIKVLDEELRSIRTFTPFDRYHLVNDLAIQQEEIIMVGNEIAKDYQGEVRMHYRALPYQLYGSHIFLQTFDRLGQKAPNPLDVALVGIAVDGPPQIENLGYECQGLAFSAVSIKIENTGTETIQSLALNSRFNRCQAICQSAFTYHYPFENLNLAPGSSLSLPIGDFSAPGVPQDSDIELCFWLSLPNHKSDQIGANDMLCQSFIINGLTEINSSFQVNLFPNPVHDQLRIGFEAPLVRQVEGAIFNVLGQRLQVFTFLKGSQRKELELSMLPSGTYFLKIGEYQKKFIKAN